MMIPQVDGATVAPDGGGGNVVVFPARWFAQAQPSLAVIPAFAGMTGRVSWSRRVDEYVCRSLLIATRHAYDAARPAATVGEWLCAVAATG
jgi:hypothetical protein